MAELNPGSNTANDPADGVAAWRPRDFTQPAGVRTLFKSFYEGLYDG